MRKKSIIGAVCLGLIGGLFQGNLTSHAQATSNSETFLIQNHSVEDLGNTTENEFFKYTFVSKSSNGQYDGNRINYFDFGQTFTLKSNPDKQVTSLKLIYDNVYYSVNYWGGNPIGTAMIWDNASHAYKLPNPWNASDGSVLDTSTSLSSVNNTDGVKMFITDLTPSVANVSDLMYIPKGDVTTIENQTMADVQDINNAFGYNIKEPSYVPVTAELPGLEYTIDPSLVGVPITKTLRIHQEKIGQYGLDGGRWYGMSFSPKMGYTYEYTRTLSVTNPETALDVMKGNTASFTSTLSMDNADGVTYDTIWQVSKDGGVTYTDISGSENIETYGFQVSGSDNNSLYRMKVTPVGVISQNAELYSESAQLTVTIPESDLGHIHGKYVDENNKTISEDVDLTGEIGTQYHLDAKTIEGYTLKEVNGAVDGTYEAGDKDITFVYKKDVVTEPINVPKKPSTPSTPNTPTEPVGKASQAKLSKAAVTPPKTGDTILPIGFGVLLLLAGSVLVITYRRRI